MTRIFQVLATFAILFLLGTLATGLMRMGDKRENADPQSQQRAVVHFMAGLSAGVVVMLVNSIVVTYFIGTSRWCKEVVDTYRLNNDFVRRSTHLKRRTFPIAVVSMLVAVGIAALGGAADTIRTPPIEGLTWANLHFMAACLGIGAIFYGFVLEGINIRANHTIILEVVAEVKRIRAERGLPD